MTLLENQAPLSILHAEISRQKHTCFWLKSHVTLSRGELEKKRRSTSNPFFVSFLMVYRLSGEKTCGFSKMRWRYSIVTCSTPLRLSMGCRSKSFLDWESFVHQHLIYLLIAKNTRNRSRPSLFS